MAGERQIILDPDEWQYIGADADTWSYCQNPTQEHGHHAYITVSDSADDPGSVAGNTGGSLAPGGKWQSSGGDAHVYVRGRGYGILLEGI